MPRINLARVIESLTANGKVNQKAQAFLEQTRSNVEPLLIKNLHSHSDPLMRELCATILGERGKERSIPALLRALRDPSEHVRFDVLIAIEKCAGVGPGRLSDALRLNRKKPREVAKRVSAWWNIVRSSFQV